VTAVVFRTPEFVQAVNLATGETVWRSLPFPMYRDLSLSGRRARIHMSMMPELGDDGRYTVSVGDGKMFAVGRFLRPEDKHIRNRRGQVVPGGDDSSELRAYKLNGKLAWHPGRSDRHKIVKAARFLSAPTYADGRLYVMARYMQSYHLICLRSEDGRYVWSAMVAQEPVTGSRYGYQRRAQGSPPAVADGRVFVTTNAGVVAAFEADSGRPVWAYQYDSGRQNSSHSRRHHYMQRKPLAVRKPANPLIVAKGRVFCLPTDCEELLALGVDSGRLDWSVDRQDQYELSFIDEERLLLSGPDLLLIDSLRGRVVKRIDVPGRIAGRPAVTERAILASATDPGRLFQVALPGLEVTHKDLVKEDGLLGNLVSAEGKLVAANVAGLTAYFPYKSYRETLTESLKNASPDRVAELLYRRGMNAFNARKPAEALPDLLKAHELAKERGEDVLAGRANWALYRTCVALGNLASDRGKMFQMFKQANDYAAELTPRARGEMYVRMVKYYGRFGQASRAAEVAHELAEKFKGVDLVDVKIGSEADPYVRSESDDPQQPAGRLAQGLIAALIDEHGQGCYAAFDTKARQKLDAAVSDPDVDAMLAVAREYPHSRWAPLALLRAAEHEYRQGLSAKGDQRRELLVSAGLHLAQVSREYPDSDLRGSATVGKALIFQKLGSQAVHWFLQEARSQPASTPVSFAGLEGRLGEVISRFGAATGSDGGDEPLIGKLDGQVQRAFRLKGGPGLILRRPEGRTIRLGRKLLALRGNELVCFNPYVESGEHAEAWSIKAPVDPGKAFRYRGGRAYGLSAGLSTDGKALAVCTGGGAFGVDLTTRKIALRISANDRRISTLRGLDIDGDRMAIVTRSYTLHVIDIRNGKELWKQSLPRKQGIPLVPPQLSGRLLLTVSRTGNNPTYINVYDVASKRLLGTMKTPHNLAQARLTGNGLLVVNTNESLQLIEPVLGLDRPLWSRPLKAGEFPAMLAVGPDWVALSPAKDEDGVQMISLSDFGKVSFTAEAEKVGGTPSPVRADRAAGRLRVVCGQVHQNHRALVLGGYDASVREPSVQVFDVADGKRLWAVKAASSHPRLGDYVYLANPAGKHAVTMSKPRQHSQATRLTIRDSDTGRTVQTIKLPPAQRQNVNGAHGYNFHRLIDAPVVLEGVMVVETNKGIEVYR
jgi:outer membrane protein assembly factor BamB